jgi:TusA-related sulfurtransferase
MEINSTIDIKGEHCPFTFVRSKLAIEKMSSGEVLEIITDHQPATENVPRSMENEGHKVLEVVKLNDTDWRIVVRKI